MNTILKRIAAAVTAAAVTVTAGIFTASADAVTYEVSTDSDNLTNIMKSYCFIALDELDISGHQHGSAIAKMITKNPKPENGTDVMSELCLRDEYGATTTYIEEFENLNGIVKIGYNKDTLRVGEGYTVRVNGNEKFIVCEDGTGCEHKVESAGTVIADTALNKYMDLDNLKKSFISYNKQLAKTSASGNVTVNGQIYSVDAMDGVVYYNIDSANYNSINADAVIDFPANSTAILVLNIDMNGITWNRKPFVLTEGGSSVTFNEDVFWHETANRIYYNFYDSSKADLQYTGAISLTEKGWGTIIAPSAGLTAGSNFCGVIIANSIAANGETHFVKAYNPVTPIPEVNTEFKAEIKFNKIDSEKNVALVGALFGIYSTADCSGTPISSSSSDASGVVYFQDISAGTYYLKEIQAPSGYSKNNTIYSVLVQFDSNGNGSVTFDGGKTQLTVPNDPIKAVVTTKATTKVTTEVTTKATTKTTTKPTTEATTKTTTETTKVTTYRPTKPTATTKLTTEASTENTTETTTTATTYIPTKPTAPTRPTTAASTTTNIATTTTATTTTSGNLSNEIIRTTSRYAPSTIATTSKTTQSTEKTNDTDSKNTSVNVSATAGSKTTTSVFLVTDEKSASETTVGTTASDNDDITETNVTTSTDTTKPPVDDDSYYDDNDDDDDDYDYDDDDNDDDDDDDYDNDCDDDDNDYDNDDDNADDTSEPDSDSDVSSSVQTTDGSEMFIVETSDGGMTWIETPTGSETSTGITSSAGDNPYTGVENAAGFAIIFGELALAAAILKKKK